MRANASGILWIAIVVCIQVFILLHKCNCKAHFSDLYKLALEQGITLEDDELLEFRRVENIPQRFRRQELIYRPKSTARPIATVSQPLECGINGKTLSKIRSQIQGTVLQSSGRIDWPWMVALLHRNVMENFCGGVLLNKNYVLTAAHCVQGSSPNSIIIRLGEYDLVNTNDTESMDYTVAEVKIHNDYDSATQRHDIALIRLQRSVEYSTYIRPVCLPNNPTIKTNQTAVVAGWGMVFYGGPSSDILLEVPIPIWDLNNCISKYAQPIFDTNLCAAAYEGGKDACSGDSGGPLLMQEPNGRWTSIGVVSWGIGCGGKNQPGVYTKVDSYINWITSKMSDAIL